MSSPAQNTLTARRFCLTFTCTTVLVISGVGQTRKPLQPPTSAPLSAQAIAKSVIPSVVLLVTRNSQGRPTHLGSGFFVDRYTIATNYHVIANASSVYITLQDREFPDLHSTFETRGTLGIDRDNDLALLEIPAGFVEYIPETDKNPPKWPLRPPLKLSSANRPEVGDVVYVVGNPKGMEGTFSQGIVSSVRQDEYLQITAPISPGSSGGPVLNTKGEVIGIVRATIEQGQNLNFAIPVARLRDLIGRRSPVAPLSSK